MTKRVALVTGITGQDGLYLSELLLSKGYQVHGMKRRSSMFNTQRIDHLYQDPHEKSRDFHLHHGDLTDATNVIRIIKEVQPTEIYNLGAMSHVMVSFDSPVFTANTNGLGALRILEAIRLLDLVDKTRYYQSSTSELFGNAQQVPQSEHTPLHPRSPYGVAKLFAYWTTINYREAYGLFACNGILFNHESPVRGETFVTRKITRAAVRIALGMQKTLYLGNLNACRDWGHAKDFARAMWLILQHDSPGEFVIATGISTSIRRFVQLAFEELGIEVHFQGESVNETGIVAASQDSKFNLPVGQEIVCVDPGYFRPTETGNLVGDASKAEKILGWKPEYDLRRLIKEMIKADLKLARQELKLSKQS